MQAFSSFAIGFALMAGLIVAVGAQNAFVLRQGLRREHAAATALFCATADVALLAAGVAGLGALAQDRPGVTAGLAAGGALYLAWQGATALRRAARPGATLGRDAGSAPSLRAALAQAAGFTLLNPHVYLDTVVLAGSVGAAQPDGARAAFVAGAGLASAGWFAALAFGARLLAPLFARPGAWRTLDLVVGATMLFLAAGLAGYAFAGAR